MMTKEDFLSGKEFEMRNSALDRFRFRENKWNGDVVYTKHPYCLTVPENGLYAATVNKITDSFVQVYTTIFGKLVHVEMKFQDMFPVESEK